MFTAIDRALSATTLLILLIGGVSFVIGAIAYFDPEFLKSFGGGYMESNSFLFGGAGWCALSLMIAVARKG